MKRLFAILTAALLIASACSSDDSETKESDDKSTTTTLPDVEGAFSAFCESATTLVDDLEEYTGLFSQGSTSLTVGQVKAGSEDLKAARGQVEQDATALQDSIDDFNSIQEQNAKDQEEQTGTTSTTVVELPVDDATIERVVQAENDFDDAVTGIDDDTPLSEAEVEFQSAAYALQVSWSVLLSEAGCLDEDQQTLDQIRQYTAGLQTDLQTLGYYNGKVDGIYGPETVDAMQAFQAEVGLPQTGLPDPATQKALNEKLAAQKAVNVSALQGLLAGLGLYDGPIDGIYNDQLTEAVKELQAQLGVPQTGVMDPATWEAYANRRAGLEELLRQAEANATSTTTEAPTTEAPTTAAPTTEAPETTTTAAP
ncbi:MAG: peptidoglycan-binding protein [Actinomycetia bacterium]|nr:peptidoglycan-binding protein [Actinomycetes bacterium]